MVRKVKPGKKDHKQTGKLVNAKEVDDEATCSVILDHLRELRNDGTCTDIDKSADSLMSRFKRGLQPDKIGEIGDLDTQLLIGSARLFTDDLQRLDRMANDATNGEWVIKQGDIESWNRDIWPSILGSEPYAWPLGREAMLDLASKMHDLSVSYKSDKERHKTDRALKTTHWPAAIKDIMSVYPLVRPRDKAWQRTLSDLSDLTRIHVESWTTWNQTSNDSDAQELDSDSEDDCQADELYEDWEARMTIKEQKLAEKQTMWSELQSRGILPDALRLRPGDSAAGPEDAFSEASGSSTALADVKTCQPSIATTNEQ